MRLAGVAVIDSVAKNKLNLSMLITLPSSRAVKLISQSMNDGLPTLRDTPSIL